MKAGDVVQYGLYAITAALGVALVVWLVRSRSVRQQHELELRRAKVFENGSRKPAPTVRAVPTPSPSPNMAEALAGIRLPVHWQPDPPVEVRSPFTLTTTKDTAGDMAETLTDELARIGYRIKPTGVSSARAERDDKTLAIEVDADESGSFVSSRITLIGSSSG